MAATSTALSTKGHDVQSSDAGGAVTSAANPNPARITDESWWLMEQLLALESGSRNGGIYANKPGYHNTRAGNLSSDYSVRDPEDRGGPSDKAAGYDWTFLDAKGGTYGTIARYSQRLRAAGESGDPRVAGWKEFFGQADNDIGVEGWDFREGKSATSDASHLWHIHLSEDRDKVTNMDNKRAILSVLKGESLADWLAGGTLTGTPADITGDGRPDLIARWTDGNLYLYQHTGNAAAPYAGKIQIGTGWNGMTALAVADVSGDGRPDLVARRTDGVLFLYTHTGSATAPFAGAIQIGIGWNSVTTLTLADVSGDGKPDILGRWTDGTLYLYQHSGSATTPYGAKVPIGTGWNEVTAMVAADVTLDGRPDIVARFSDGKLYRYAHSGNTTTPYTGRVEIGIGWNEATAIDVTDVTGDQRPDIVARFGDGKLYLYAHTGNATTPYGGRVDIGIGWNVVTALT